MVTHTHPQNKVNADVQGVLLLDKPLGMISQKALQAVKRSVGAERAGHIGTLDPLATGLLPIMLGDATRYALGWERADKVYTATIQLGGQSSTDDCAGEITPVALPPASTLTAATLNQALQAQVGEIAQIPPLYSAVRVDGKKLYQVARRVEALQAKGSTPAALPERPLRRVRIHSIELVAWRADQAQLDINVHCGSGTFIRAIARDVAVALGTGGYLTAIRRVGFGASTLTQAINLDQWLAAVQNGTWKTLLLPTEIMLTDYPIVHLSDEQTYRLICGQKLQVLPEDSPLQGIAAASLPSTTCPLRLYYQRRLIGMGKVVQDEGVKGAEGALWLRVGRMLPTGDLMRHTDALRVYARQDAKESAI